MRFFGLTAQENRTQKLQQQMMIWENQICDGLCSHGFCSHVCHVLALTLKWAGPRPLPLQSQWGAWSASFKIKLKSSPFPQFCQCVATGDLSCLGRCWVWPWLPHPVLRQVQSPGGPGGSGLWRGRSWPSTRQPHVAAGVQLFCDSRQGHSSLEVPQIWSSIQDVPH